MDYVKKLRGFSCWVKKKVTILKQYAIVLRKCIKSSLKCIVLVLIRVIDFVYIRLVFLLILFRDITKNILEILKILKKSK